MIVLVFIWHWRRVLRGVELGLARAALNRRDYACWSVRRALRRVRAMTQRRDGFEWVAYTPDGLELEQR